MLWLVVMGAVAVEPPAAALQRAAFLGQVETLREALAKGAAVDAPGEHEWTALHWAAIGDRPEAAALLLEHGANPDARGQYDMTPLHWAAMRGADRVVTALLARGARADSRNLWGMTPLHEAANERVVSALLEGGAKLEQRDGNGLTPLFTARSKAVGQALLARGADLHARAADGRTLFDMLVWDTVQPQGLMLYARRTAGRLRGDEVSIEVQLRNISPAPIAKISLRAESEAATVTAPPQIERLAPAQLARASFALKRNGGTPEGVYPMIVAVSLEGRQMATFELDVDNNRGETPADLGMIRLGQAKLKRTSSSWYDLAFLAVPVLILAGWLISRRRAKAK